MQSPAWTSCGAMRDHFSRHDGQQDRLISDVSLSLRNLIHHLCHRSSFLFPKGLLLFQFRIDAISGQTELEYHMR